MPPQRNPVIGSNALEIREGSVHLEPVDIPNDEVTLPGSQVMDAIGQLVSAIDRDKIVRQLVERIGYSLKDFCNHHLESFDGSGNHIHAENWLNNLKELLATLGCTNE
jgi:hypothetical protein